jgi:hypothetical protein
MFAHDLCDSQIEYVRDAIDLNRKDRAKRYHKSSIFNCQFPDKAGFTLRYNRLVRLGLQYQSCSAYSSSLNFLSGSVCATCESTRAGH